MNAHEIHFWRPRGLARALFVGKPLKLQQTSEKIYPQAQKLRRKTGIRLEKGDKGCYQSGVGYADREYMQSRSPRPPGMFDGTPVVKWLFFANVAIFFLGILSSEKHFSLSPLYTWGEFTIQGTWFDFQLWRVLTYQFLHAGPVHLAVNMIGLYFFGRHVELMMGQRPFLLYYLVCGVAGVIFYTFLYNVPGIFEGYGPEQGMVGASAALLGLLAVFMVHAPRAKVLLFFVIPMEVKTFAILFFVFETLNVIFGIFNEGGSAGHLGGALCGLFFMKNPRAFAKLSALANGISKKKQKIYGARHARVQDAKIVSETRLSPYEESREVDRILDKISEKGFESLSREEREFLNNARKHD